MSDQTRKVTKGRRPGTVIAEDGQTLEIPRGWALLAPGDAGLTRRVKALGPSWTVIERRRGRAYSQGVWAPKAHVEAAQRAIEEQRAQPRYQKQLAGAKRRRDQRQVAYVDKFEGAVRDFLSFAPRHRALAARLARVIALHATPVGSGTVARTQRIPVERRAEAATIAWMRHQTTAYDDMAIPRIKGMRRDVRRRLADRSRALLSTYRKGEQPLDGCPLLGALESMEAPERPSGSVSTPEPQPQSQPKPQRKLKPQPKAKPSPVSSPKRSWATGATTATAASKPMRPSGARSVPEAAPPRPARSSAFRAVFLGEDPS